MNLLQATLALTLASPAFATDLSKPSLTPGAIDPYIKHKDIHSAICVKGHTKAIRRPGNFTNTLNKLQLSEYEYEDRSPKLYEEQHLIPLSIDDTANGPRELWPRPHKSEWDVGNKDRFELEFHRIVCVNKITYCGSTAHDAEYLALGIQQSCTWKSISSWTWIWSCRLKKASLLPAPLF
jgi:hypothetical protein